MRERERAKHKRELSTRERERSDMSAEKRYVRGKAIHTWKSDAYAEESRLRRSPVCEGVPSAEESRPRRVPSAESPIRRESRPQRVLTAKLSSKRVKRQQMSTPPARVCWSTKPAGPIFSLQTSMHMHLRPCAPAPPAFSVLCFTLPPPEASSLCPPLAVTCDNNRPTDR